MDLGILMYLKDNIFIIYIYIYIYIYNKYLKEY
jgi:hypothetical protein